VKAYIHKKSGKKYVVTGEVFMKNSVTRQWDKAFIYAPLLPHVLDTKIYVREQKDFYNKFVSDPGTNTQGIDLK